MAIRSRSARRRDAEERHLRQEAVLRKLGATVVEREPSAHELLKGGVVDVVRRRDSDYFRFATRRFPNADQDVRRLTTPSVRERQDVLEQLRLLFISRLHKPVLLVLEVERFRLATVQQPDELSLRHFLASPSLYSTAGRAMQVHRIPVRDDVRILP